MKVTEQQYVKAFDTGKDSTIGPNVTNFEKEEFICVKK